MANGNLKGKGFDSRTTNEQREIARKGGKASGKARREKADMRKIAQAILDGTFEDKNGLKFTGIDLVQKGIMANLSDPEGKNWGKAMDLLVTLTGANVSAEQRKAMKAQTQKIKAEIKRMSGSADNDVEDLSTLAEMLKHDENADN